ncbi:T9SS type A sorting domain-containing protein [Reichenbachiella sp.]|uniref:T9SS type A sorting domain-containing protein n=1 Tax=Reichenbachiella sp. TaxID=2184521 RepID=UPI003BAEC00B
MKKLFLSIAILTFTQARAQTFDVHTPKTFAEILVQTYDETWTPSTISAIENLKHIILLDASAQTDALIWDDATTSTTSFKNKDHLSGSSATYSSLLRGMFQLVDINSNTDAALSGQYLIKPLLNSYAALNTDGSSLITSDAGSYYADDTGGYLVFELEGLAASTTIKAVAQYDHNSSTAQFESNESWTTQWLMISGEDLALTSTEGDASAFYLANPFDLIDFSLEVGSDFNPGSTAWQDNEFAAYPDEVWDYEDSDLFGDQLLKDVDESYQSQFGNSSEVSAAASEALDEIATALTNEGASLRYDQSVYLTFRENLLARTFGANDIYNSKLDESTVEYVYFTNATDDEGLHHPFMVIASHNASDGPNFLIDVARPPGDGEGGGYEEQTITRNAVLEVKLVKIPLKDYGLVQELTDNDLSDYGSLANDMNLGASEYDTYNYTGTSSSGIAIDGVVIYPSYNNNLRVAAADAEITSMGIHVGRGMGLHYHADGHGYNGNGINLYNYSDYDGKDHPPLIGFAYDGVALFGKYEVNYSEMAGYSEELDDYGGHDHSDFGYHYHAFAGDMTYEDQGETVGPFTQHHLLVGAWRGNINNIPGFSEVSTAQLKEEDTGRFAGATYDASTATTLSVANLENAMKVYPNPNTGVFVVEVDGVQKLTLYDLNGRIKQTVRVENNKTLFESKNLGKGLFVIKGNGLQSSYIQKVIIK